MRDTDRMPGPAAGEGRGLAAKPAPDLIRGGSPGMTAGCI